MGEVDLRREEERGENEEREESPGFLSIVSSSDLVHRQRLCAVVPAGRRHERRGGGREQVWVFCLTICE